MTISSIQKRAFFNNYDAFIKAVEENEPWENILKISTSILTPPPSLKAVDIQRIIGQLKALSPQDSLIQSIVHKILEKTTSLSNPKALSDKKFAAFKNHCGDFITLIADPLTEKEQKTLATKSFLEKINAIPCLKSNQASELLKIRTLLTMISNINDDPTTKEAIKTVTTMLNELIETFQNSQKQAPSSVEPTSPKGINNQGNDCFLIALCQLLRSKSLTEHLVNRLPKELLEPLIADNPNAKFIRRAIVKYTSLAAGNHDPMYGQLDVTETLTALLNRIDEPDMATPSPTPPPITPEQPSLRETYENDYNDATEFLEKTKLFMAFWITTLYESIKSCLISPVVTMLGYNSDSTNPDNAVSANYIPQITAARPENRPAKNSPNPLNLHIKTTIKYTPEKTTPIEHRNHENFGGAEHKHTPHEPPSPLLALPMERTPEGIYHFEHILKTYFLNHNEDEPAKLTVDVHRKKTTYKRTYKAFKEKTTTLTQVPDFLLLSLRRFTFDYYPKKINDPVEGLDLEIILPEEILETPTPAANREYTLQSFVSHIGTSSGGGHYVSYRKEEDGWHYFNDETHIPVTDDEAKKAAKDAYLVFYERKK